MELPPIVPPLLRFFGKAAKTDMPIYQELYISSKTWGSFSGERVPVEVPPSTGSTARSVDN